MLKLPRAFYNVHNIEGKTTGPGLLCRAMNFDRSMNGRDLASDHLYIAANSESEKFEIVERPRIGVDYAGEWAEKPLRFYIKELENGRRSTDHRCMDAASHPGIH